jgi:hypothetical protein
MGNCGNFTKPTKNYKLITNRFNTYGELEKALKDCGLESSNLIIGIDFTKSNMTNGGAPYFQSPNLHNLCPSPNLYQQVITMIGNTLSNFDDDQLIPTYGFGDLYTTDKAVFSFLTDPNTRCDCPCYTLNQVLDTYTTIANEFALGIRQMSGPTSFAPIIRKAIEIVRQTKSYHILLIIADGEITNKRESIEAIVEASYVPLSIVCIGIGKANFATMETFDDDIKERKFDNFQFVDFYKTMKGAENSEYEFAKQALMEIPDQYDYIKKHIL